MISIQLVEGCGYERSAVEELVNFLVDGLPVLVPQASSGAGGVAKKFRLRFVGVITTPDAEYICVPKYCSSLPEEFMRPTMGLVLKAIDRYKRMSHDSPLSEKLGNSSDDHLAVSVFLLREWVASGKYWSEDSSAVNAGNWRIDWSRTVLRRDPIIERDRPVYVEFDMRRTVRNEDHLVSRIHAAVASEASASLAGTFLAEFFGLPHLPASDETLNDLGETDYLIDVVKREKAAQFVSWKLRVLNALERYLLLKSGQGDFGFRWSGTTHFENVWEAACRQVFSSSLTDYSLRPPTWDVIADRASPEGMGLGSLVEERVMGLGSLRPDAIASENRDLYILDAKYYNPTYTASRLLAGPGVNDVMKQHFYQVALESVARNDGLEIKGNAFLLPAVLPASFHVFVRGQVSLPAFSDFLSTRSAGAGVEERSDGPPVLPIMVFELDAEFVLSFFITSRFVSGRLGQLFSLERGEFAVLDS